MLGRRRDASSTVVFLFFIVQKKKDRLISRKSKHFYLDKVCDLCRGYYYDSSAIFHGWFPRIHCNRVNQIDTYLIIFIEFFSNFVCFCKHKITITTTQNQWRNNCCSYFITRELSNMKIWISQIRSLRTPRRDATCIILAGNYKISSRHS